MMKSYFDKRKRVTDYLKIPNLSSKFQLNQDEHVVHNIISETSKEHLVDEIKHLRNIDGKLLLRTAIMKSTLPMLMRFLL